MVAENLNLSTQVKVSKRARSESINKKVKGDEIDDEVVCMRSKALASTYDSEVMWLGARAVKTQARNWRSNKTAMRYEPKVESNGLCFGR